MDQISLINVYEKIGKLSIKNINFYVFHVSMQSCKDCQTVQTLYKTRINLPVLSDKFLSLAMKTKY